MRRGWPLSKGETVTCEVRLPLCYYGKQYDGSVSENLLPRACLKNAFCKMYVTVCGTFVPDEGVVAGYDNRIRDKGPAKWGVQIAGMIFQTHSKGNKFSNMLMEREKPIKRCIMSFISYLKDGISLGSIYAIIALGYTMVYGIAKMLNFAHGDVIMVGAFVILTAVTKASLSPFLAIVLSVVICTVMGVVIEAVAYRPLRKASSNLAVLITAIGVSYLLQNLALLIFGADAKSFVPVINVPTLNLFDGQLQIKGITIVTILACIVIMVGLQLFVKKTKPGRAMQAVSEDRDAAQLMGINVNGTISLTFAIGSGLAAIAGLLLCSAYPTLTPYTGAMPGIKAFVAAVFGGIGSIPGAMVGGILLGVIEIFSKAYISSQVADALVFAVLIVVLLVKPSGLFGKNIQEKV